MYIQYTSVATPRTLAVQLPMLLVPAGASICPVNQGGGSTIAAGGALAAPVAPAACGTIKRLKPWKKVTIFAGNNGYNMKKSAIYGYVP